MDQEHAPAAAGHATSGGYDFNAFLADPVTWTGVGLLIFIGAMLFLKVPGSIAKSLDDRAAKIRSELDNAAALRREAEVKLKDAERRQAEAEQQAREIVEAARREADATAKAAAAALAERIALREKLAEERISRAGEEARREVKLAAAEAASKAAAAILADHLSGPAADANFAQSLEQVKKALSS